MSERPSDETRRSSSPLRAAFVEAMEKWRYNEAGCPPDGELVAYLESTLPFKRRLAIWWHVRRCALCRADLLEFRETWLIPGEPKPRPQLVVSHPFPALLPQPGRLALALGVVGIILVGAVMYQYGRRVERGLHASTSVQETLDKQFRDTTNPRITFTLATLYAEAGEWEKSLDYLDRAIQQDHTYAVHAEQERAFANLRDPAQKPYHTQFVALLRRYQSPQKP